jgi:hypothetical protein
MTLDDSTFKIKTPFENINIVLSQFEGFEESLGEKILRSWSLCSAQLSWSLDFILFLLIYFILPTQGEALYSH